MIQFRILKQIFTFNFHFSLSLSSDFHLCGSIWPRGLPGSCGDRGLGGLRLFILEFWLAEISHVFLGSWYEGQVHSYICYGWGCSTAFLSWKRFLCSPATVVGQLLEGDVALKVFRTVALSARKTTHWLKICKNVRSHFQMRRLIPWCPQDQEGRMI